MCACCNANSPRTFQRLTFRCFVEYRSTSFCCLFSTAPDCFPAPSCCFLPFFPPLVPFLPPRLLSPTAFLCRCYPAPRCNQRVQVVLSSNTEGRAEPLLPRRRAACAGEQAGLRGVRGRRERPRLSRLLACAALSLPAFPRAERSLAGPASPRSLPFPGQKRAGGHLPRA